MIGEKLAWAGAFLVKPGGQWKFGTCRHREYLRRESTSSKTDGTEVSRFP